MATTDTVVIVASPDGYTSQWVNWGAGLAGALGKNVVVAGRRGAGKTALLRYFRDNAEPEVDDVA